MKRRTFSQQAVGAAVAATAPWWAATAAAQAGAPVEGQHYARLAQPVPVPAGGKIDVVEFFWYGCPHCNSFEPQLDAWAKRQPADVAVRRMPVAFRENPFVAHQKIYFALEALGRVDTLHRKVFAAIHVERQKLDKPDEIAAFMAKNGIDQKTFLDAYNSFGVQTKVRQAKALADGYKIDGVPALGVGGRFFTSSTLAGSPERALAVVEFLIQRVRRGA